MHHLRLDLRGPDLAADLLRSRLQALGAEPVDGEGRVLVLVTASAPAHVKREVMEDVPRSRIDAERFELYGRDVLTERWNPRSTSTRSTRPLDDEGLVRDDDRRSLRRDAMGDPYWDGGWSPIQRPEPLLPATCATLDAVRSRPTPGATADREDVLGFLVGLGRLARSAGTDDPALLDAAAFLLEQGARAAARSTNATELGYERGLLATRAAWAADRRTSDEPLLEVLEALADAGARLTRWARRPEVWAGGALERACHDALVACVRAMVPTPQADSVGDAARVW